MKNIIPIIVLSLGFVNATRNYEPDRISGRLELSIREDSKLGKLIAVRTRIENLSNQKLYLDGILPLHFRLLKKMENGIYQDYTDGWVSDEVTNDKRNEIGEAIGQANYQERGCKIESETFIGPFVSSFFHDQLLNKKLIKTKEDSTDLRFWLCHQFAGLLYLKPHEVAEDIDGINSLPEGSYKIFFRYSNKNGYARRVSPYERFAKFQLPDKLNGFERWRGEIIDTLFLEIK
jgi:hypothetical protein